MIFGKFKKEYKLGHKNHDQPETYKVNSTEHSESSNDESSENFDIKVIADETIEREVVVPGE